MLYPMRTVAYVRTPTTGEPLVSMEMLHQLCYLIKERALQFSYYHNLFFIRNIFFCFFRHIVNHKHFENRSIRNKMTLTLVAKQ